MSIDTDFLNEVEKLNVVNSMIMMSAHLDHHTHTEHLSQKVGTDRGTPQGLMVPQKILSTHAQALYL